MTIPTKNPANWIIALTNDLNTTLAKHGAPTDDDLAQELRKLMLDIARSQYIAGNRSGLRWANTQQNK